MTIKHATRKASGLPDSPTPPDPGFPDDPSPNPIPDRPNGDPPQPTDPPVPNPIQDPQPPGVDWLRDPWHKLPSLRDPFLPQPTATDNHDAED